MINRHTAIFMKKSLYTIGHSSHSIDDFIAMLKAHDISHLVDIRTIPKSRHVPWFNQVSLEKVLKKEKIAYTHLSALGGLRHTNKDSINQGWNNLSFRGFADYMQTKEFFEGLKSLHEIIKKDSRVAIMCAEALPWRCHRSLVADAEVIRGINVFHIMSKTNLHPHELTAFAVVNKNKRPIQIYYPHA